MKCFYEGDSIETMLGKLQDNLTQAASEYWDSEESALSEYVENIRFAVRVKNNEQRDRIAKLSSDLKYRRTRSAEGNQKFERLIKSINLIVEKIKSNQPLASDEQS